MFKSALKIGAAAVVAMTGVAGIASAQPAAESGTPAAASTNNGIGDVVITARKREENLQRVPVSVTALTSNQLTQQVIRQPSDLTRSVPSLTVGGASGASGTAAVPSIRGQAAGDLLLPFSEPVGLYEDTVNIPHAIGTNISFFDLQRVEVLKGPQGTLYGRNTTGGAINIITRDADFRGIHGYVYGEGGNFADWKAAGAVNVPVIDDVLAVRLAYQHWNRDGFGQSVVTGEKFGDPKDDDIARASIKFTPTSNFTGNFKVEYVNAQRTDSLYQTVIDPSAIDPIEYGVEHAEGFPDGNLNVAQCVALAQTNIFANCSPFNTFEHLTAWHSVSDLKWDINDALSVRSITGYHQFTDLRTFDLQGLPLDGTGPVGQGIGGIPIFALGSSDQRPLKPDQESRTVTQEFDLSGKSFDHLNWLVGVFGEDDRGAGDESVPIYPAITPTPRTFDFDTLENLLDTWGIYTQDDFKFNDVFSITAGLRYSEERLKTVQANYGLDLSDTVVPPGGRYRCNTGFGGATATTTVDVPTAEDCGLNQKAKFDGTSYLLSFNFQLDPSTLLYVKTARGFRGGVIQARAIGVVSPEIAEDYEVGFKSEFFDKRLRTDIALYHTNYTNKQESAIIQTIINGVPAASTTLTNAATAQINGVEAEITAVPVHNLTLNAAITYLNGQYNSFPNAPNPDFLGGAALPQPCNALDGGVSLTQCQTYDASGTQFTSYPPWVVNIGGRYVIPHLGPGDLGISANWYWHSKTPQAVIASTVVPQSLTDEWTQARGLINASADYTLPNLGLTLSAFVTNLTDEEYQGPGTTIGTTVVAQTADPRMWGFGVRKSFGDE